MLQQQQQHKLNNNSSLVSVTQADTCYKRKKQTLSSTPFPLFGMNCKNQENLVKWALCYILSRKVMFIWCYVCVSWKDNVECELRTPVVLSCFWSVYRLTALHYLWLICYMLRMWILLCRVHQIQWDDTDFSSGHSSHAYAHSILDNSL